MIRLSLFLTLFLALLSAPTFAQSTNENSPTPVNASEISGTIAARDIGDARLTQHFYTFFANNGDVDLNVETANFDGDIDLFEVGTLRPLAKITVFNSSGGATNTTARTVYFRKRAQVVMRIEGRTLSEDAARYRINFGGSFEAANLPDDAPAQDEPKTAAKTSGAVVARVNSAGAIIEVLPVEKPITETAKVADAKIEEKDQSVMTKKVSPRTARTRRTNTKTAATPKPDAAENQTETDAKTTGLTASTNDKTSTSENGDTSLTPEKNVQAAPSRRSPRRSSAARKPVANANQQDQVLPPNALANVRLVIELKNGKLLMRPMSEVFNLNVDKELITVITKAGKIERYKLLDVQKMSIE